MTQLCRMRPSAVGVIVLAISLTVVMGCATAPPASLVTPAQEVDAQYLYTDYADFGPRPQITSEHELFHLNEDQRQHFLNYFDDPLRQASPAHQRVVDYILLTGERFGFQGATHTAEQTLINKGGNCLSLAILTTALARLAEVDVGYQLVRSTPVYQQTSGITLKQQHVRSFLYASESDKPEDNAYVMRRAGLIVDYFPSGHERFIGSISESDYIAMYYRNIAADGLIGKDFSLSFWMLLKSFEFAPDHPDGINMMAVLHRQTGDIQRAEKLYLYGIEHSDGIVSLLKNYRDLLVFQGRMSEAHAIEGQLENLEDDSPYNWLAIADSAYLKRDYTSALAYYRKAEKLAPYLHEVYLGKANSYYQMGKHKAAREQLELARENAWGEQDKALYDAKLAFLGQI